MSTLINHLDVPRGNLPHYFESSEEEVELQEEFIETRLQLLSLQSLKMRGAFNDSQVNIEKQEKELQRKLYDIEKQLSTH